MQRVCFDDSFMDIECIQCNPVNAFAISICKKCTARQRIILEFITSERTYRDDLRVLVEAIHPIEEILPQLEVSLIFRNINSLYQLSNQLCEDLVNEGVHGNVGQVVLRYADFFKMYAAYWIGDSQATELVYQHSHDNKQFQSVIANIKFPRGLVHLQDLLIGPTQRLPKYNLFLQEIIKLTPEEHRHSQHLKDALIKVRVHKHPYNR